MLTTSCLLVVFAIAIGYATFIENNYGTQTAQVLIYSATWFEVLLALLGFNLIGGLFYHKGFKLKRWSMVLFHLAFIIMLIGAGITRFFSFEGSMHIREGESSNSLISTDTYVTVQTENGNNESLQNEWKVLLSPYAHINFNQTLEADGKPLGVEIDDFVPGGVQSLVADETGSPAVELLVLDNGDQKSVVVGQNETVWFSNFSISFENPSVKSDIQIKRNGPGLLVNPKDSLDLFSMTGDTVAPYLPSVDQPLTRQHMFRLKGGAMFALRNYLPQARKILKNDQQAGNGADALLVNVKASGEEHQVVIFGGKGVVSEPTRLSIGGQNISLAYGSKLVELPFDLHLVDFQLERYAGSMSPSSFASEVVLKDQANQVEKPYRIYMNNILDYGGYRFFQSSYDQDEKGTILSVNHDSLGTFITYLGYFLMSLGMVFSFFNKKSRFQFLLRSASRVKEMKKKNFTVLLLAILFVPTVLQAQPGRIQFDSSHLKKLDQLLVQDRKGRIEPINTLASEVLRKLTRKNSYQGMSATEVFAGMSAMPEAWKNEPLIKISNSKLADELGIKGNFASFNDLVDLGQGIYKLRSQVDAAYKKRPNERDKYDKEVVNVDERVNICYQIFNGDFLNVFPDVTDANNTWQTEAKYFSGERSNPSPDQLLMSNYLADLRAAMLSGNFSSADGSLQKLEDFQREHGAELILADSKVKMEILYNNLNIFGWLSKLCALIGLALLVVHLMTIFNPNLKLSTVLRTGSWTVGVLFLIYTAGLSLRWYISGHAPWSNSYETLLYVGWATMLSGFVFVRKSQITLAVTSILTSLILMVAGMSWLNPEITNLVPVLKSYWLIVHVAIITASYGFLGIAALLGILNLVLMIFRNPRNIRNTAYSIVELSIVIELAMIVGLVLLTIGAFIGGVWANESWGRYWGWDPKETWALVTILVYSFIIHLRKVPGIYSNFLLSSLSMLGFSSVLMTFFGVNYYLSGMHSYGQGDPPPVPSGVYVSIVVAVLLVIFAGISERKYGRAESILKLEEE